MATSDTYRAVADSKLAMDIAAAASPFTIEVRFVGGLTKAQRKAFTAAADRWVTVIVGDLPSVVVDGELIDDILILAEGADIDGPGQILGQAGPDRIRPQSAGKAAGLPARGTMQFDKADLKAMEQKGTLNDVITHEMGHVLGIGTLWRLKGLLKGAETNNPTFSGKGAIKEYRALRGDKGNKQVPVENTGGPGTRNGHWREAVFRHELMSGFIVAANNPISRMTVASLQDIGYEVNPDSAEAYELPDLMSLAEEGLLVARDPTADGIVLPTVPMALPDDSLR